MTQAPFLLSLLLVIGSLSSCARDRVHAVRAASSDYVWSQSGYEDFIQGTLGDGGANTYVSADGRIQLINRWDLNHDGHIDLVFAKSPARGTPRRGNLLGRWKRL